MLVKTVKLSSKGQLTLPVEILRALRAKRGFEFVVVQEGGRILLLPAQTVARQALDDLTGFETLALKAFQGVWDNPSDEIWNEA